MTVPYTISQDSITLVWEGKPVTVQRGAPNFLGLRNALFNENWADVAKLLTPKKGLEHWAKGLFRVDGETIYYRDEALPTQLNRRIVQMAGMGEDPTALFNFWERLSKNPSYRSVEQLFPFLEHQGIPLTPDGCFLAYKAVRADFKDIHSGTLDNSPGKVLEMPRNKISDDPRTPCHQGLHVGALEYAKGFGGTPQLIVICKVDPEHVVCVPYDSSAQKMRVCKYEVVGVYDGNMMPSTTWEPPALEENREPVEDVPALASTHPFDALGRDELLKQKMADLRLYAVHGLKIAGGGRIPGGKGALVARILQERAK